MFEDIRNELNNDDFSSDSKDGNQNIDDNNLFESTSPFGFTDDDQIDGAIQNTSTSDQFDRFGIYEEDVEEEERDQTGDDDPRILGMTASQRFIMSVMIFFMVTILGAFCLLLTGKIVLPFF